MYIVIIRKKWLVIISLIMMALLLLYFWNQRALVTTTLPVNNKVIVVDPGHGGIDGGAVARSGVTESHINLDIALKLRALLEESGALVLLTREDDTGLYSDQGRIRDKKNEDLRNRKLLINESEADILVSVHLNSFPQAQYYGAQTFYPSNSEQSKRLAELVQEELIKVLNNGNKRKAKVKDDVYILKTCQIPMVLVECGFLSNPMEEKLLQDPSYQDKIAWSIYIGIMRYFNEEAM